MPGARHARRIERQHKAALEHAHASATFGPKAKTVRAEVMRTLGFVCPRSAQVYANGWCDHCGFGHCMMR